MSTRYGAPPSDVDQMITAIIDDDSDQLSHNEYRYIADLVASRRGCNMLVFGVGNDTKLWLFANRTGRTVFIESSRFWSELARWQHPDIDIRMVRYGTTRTQWRELLTCGPARLILGLPNDIVEARWDMIFVDGPAASSDSSPGRMKSIYAASVLARRFPGTDVVVHDCDREVEQAYCDRFLGGALLVRQFERTRHYHTADWQQRDDQEEEEELEPSDTRRLCSGANAPLSTLLEETQTSSSAT